METLLREFYHQEYRFKSSILMIIIIVVTYTRKKQISFLITCFGMCQKKRYWK